MNVRLENAISAVCDAACVAAGVPCGMMFVGPDEDLIDDIQLDPLECETLRLILEEVFGVAVPDNLWATPLYRTPSSLAEWLISRSNLAAWIEAKRKCA